MVCTFEVVLAMTLTGHSWAKSCCLPIHLKEGGVAPKPSTCTVASLYVGLFRISCLRLQPHQQNTTTLSLQLQLSTLLGKTLQEKRR